MIGTTTPRRSWPLGLSLALWVGLVAAGVGLAVTHSHVGTSRPPHGIIQLRFSHVYPQDPVPFERPAVGSASPSVPQADRVHQGAALATMAQLAAVTPRGTVTSVGPGAWRLTRPIELPSRTSLVLHGPLRLELGPGAFVLAEHGAVLKLTDVTVVAVDRSGRVAVRPSGGRGYLTARSGAILQLRDDRFLDLGHLGDQTYGITADDASSAFSMTGCVVRDSFFGVYLGRLSGGLVAHNTFINPVIYGIDPHTSDTNLRILDNVVRGAGVHGIVLADRVTRTLVMGNQVTGSRDHGIVIFAASNDNVLRDNVIRSVFDGVVISNSSGNLLVGNRIGPVTRFGVRVSGSSVGNVLRGNTIRVAILGAYLYNGATGNSLVNNRFAGNYENVRVRRDAPSNAVVPNPGRSEL